MEAPMRLLEWHPYETVADTVMRRRRWYGWQTRAMTREELQAHFETRIGWWLANSPPGRAGAQGEEVNAGMEKSSPSRSWPQLRSS
jgi:hypothetical protein